jgi:hypothetical protein
MGDLSRHAGTIHGACPLIASLSAAHAGNEVTRTLTFRRVR